MRNVRLNLFSVYVLRMNSNHPVVFLSSRRHDRGIVFAVLFESNKMAMINIRNVLLLLMERILERKTCWATTLLRCAAWIVHVANNIKLRVSRRSAILYVLKLSSTFETTAAPMPRYCRTQMIWIRLGKSATFETGLSPSLIFTWRAVSISLEKFAFWNGARPGSLILLEPHNQQMLLRQPVWSVITSEKVEGGGEENILLNKKHFFVLCNFTSFSDYLKKKEFAYQLLSPPFKKIMTTGEIICILKIISCNHEVCLWPYPSCR